jgi:RNA polymerase sigma-70 factor, ECF subfamily
VNALPTSSGDSRDGPSVTLGDLLYADKGKPRVSEDDWRTLVRAIAARDQQALHALYDRAHRIVFTLIMRITQSPETAEELTLDVFHDVWKRASTYDASSGTVVGWIMNQARSRAIDRVRYEQRKKRVNPYPDDPVATHVGIGSDEIVQRIDHARVLRNALTALTAEERQAIETAFFAELTYSEVALRLNQPLGTVKTRIRAALGKLRQAFARES